MLIGLTEPGNYNCGTQKGGFCRRFSSDDDDGIGKVTFGTDSVAATKVRGMRSSREAHSSKMIGEILIDLFDET